MTTGNISNFKIGNEEVEVVKEFMQLSRCNDRERKYMRKRNQKKDRNGKNNHEKIRRDNERQGYNNKD